jgi:hypothetical protein
MFNLRNDFLLLLCTIPTLWDCAVPGDYHLNHDDDKNNNNLDDAKEQEVTTRICHHQNLHHHFLQRRKKELNINSTNQLLPAIPS